MCVCDNVVSDSVAAGLGHCVRVATDVGLYVRSEIDWGVGGVNRTILSRATSKCIHVGDCVKLRAPLCVVRSVV